MHRKMTWNMLKNAKRSKLGHGITSPLKQRISVFQNVRFPLFFMGKASGIKHEKMPFFNPILYRRPHFTRWKLKQTIRHKLIRLLKRQWKNPFRSEKISLWKQGNSLLRNNSPVSTWTEKWRLEKNTVLIESISSVTISFYRERFRLLSFPHDSSWSIQQAYPAHFHRYETGLSVQLGQSVLWFFCYGG